MSAARDAIAKVLEAGWDYMYPGIPADGMIDVQAGNVLALFAAEPAVWLAAGPEGVRRDIQLCARFTALAEERYKAVQPNGLRINALCDEAKEMDG